MNKKKFHVQVWEVGNGKAIEYIHEAKTPQEIIDTFSLRDPEVINFEIKEVTGGSGNPGDPETEYAPVPANIYTDKEIEAKVMVMFSVFKEGVEAGEDDNFESTVALIKGRFLLSDEQEAAIRILLSHTELLMQEVGGGFPMDNFCGMTTSLLISIVKNDWKRINRLEVTGRSNALQWARAQRTMHNKRTVPLL